MTARLGVLKTKLDIDGKLADANAYRIITTNSQFGKGEIATEYRALSLVMSQQCGARYERYFKVGTELWAKMDGFGKALVHLLPTTTLRR